ncbi:Fur family transcriptional regulator [Teredinibacter waterburyi]|uniref:Fur family transcriptional regulator n=1 Tax=Teredinibacter waterburyi TaxID=1500538 RepID=UPI00165ED91C|nr:Fur family transcriptional regulator [Teredinibacter waterburyi]
MASAHDHTACIERALKEADLLCANADVRLTELRRKVLELIWQSHAPLGAYRLMEMLEQASDRKRVAPPTVYRALDFLIEQKLIHKVHSLNAFIGCTRPRQPHGDALFICRECGFTEEVASKPIQQAINLSASQQRFEVEDQFMEIIGRCAACRAKQKSGASQEELL